MSKIVSLTGGVLGSPTIINTDNTECLIVKANTTSPSYYFQLASDFQVGDVVEFYAFGGDVAVLLDENGNAIESVANPQSPNGIIARKLATGSSPTWGVVTSNQ